MGDWNITISGTGAHHNKGEAASNDADVLCHEFVEMLRESGHLVTAAKITTSNGEEDLLNPKASAAAPAEAASRSKPTSRPILVIRRRPNEPALLLRLANEARRAEPAS